jgi:adenylate cyclase
LSDYVKVRVEQPERQPLTLDLESELVMGRDCEGLLLADPQVSRRHLRLRPVGRTVEIADLNSTNGSYLDGIRLSEPQLVEATCPVLVGDTMVTVRFDALDETMAGVHGRSTMVRSADDLRSTSIEMVADLVGSTSAPQAEGLAGDTVTIVFSDIESSTERATSMVDEAWYALLEEHNRIIRTELDFFGGREVKSISDGFMLAFPSVQRAIRFAVSVQQLVEAEDGPDLRVRMGLHTGEAISDAEGDLFGRHVNLTARVANLASGGQILASLVVREIAAGRDDALFGAPAKVELKGFAHLQTVYEIAWGMATK